MDVVDVLSFGPAFYLRARARTAAHFDRARWSSNLRGWLRLLRYETCGDLVDGR